MTQILQRSPAPPVQAARAGRSPSGRRNRARRGRSPESDRTTAALAIIITVAIGLLPALPLPFGSTSTGQVVLHTAGALAALFTAVALVGRALRSGTLGDVLLVAALTCLSTSEATRALDLTMTAGQLSGALVLLAAAYLPVARLRHPDRAIACALAGSALVLYADAALLATDRPPGGHLLVGAVYALSACGFARRALRERDKLLPWLAAGSALAVMPQGIVHLAFYAAIAVGLAREGVAHQGRVALDAILGERRRMARDLHDGLAQELLYIRQQGRALEAHGSGRDLAIGSRIAAAADRALDESRIAITALARPAGQPLGALLLEAARLPAERGGAEVELTGSAVAVRPELAAPLARIVGEAATNAVRHGRAMRIWMELDDGHGLVLRICDDGCGFDPDAPRSRAAFGLIGMGERVDALGGILRVESRPGNGTLVEILVP